MFNIDQLISPSSVADAYRKLQTSPGAVVLGGCAYLRLGDRKIATAIDLASLGLDSVCNGIYDIEIGAMTSLRTLETDPLIQAVGQGILVSAVRDIVGVQLRRAATIGGSVVGRYPFSDLLTALLALDAQLVFYATGTISLEEYLAGKPLADILERIIIPKKVGAAAFICLRKAKTDYAVLNVAVVKNATDFRVVVGSRPARAVRAKEVEQYLHAHGLNPDSIEQAGSLAASTLAFGSNLRGSAQYRQAICPVLIARALTEVMYAV